MSLGILETHYGIPKGCQDDQCSKARKDEIVKVLARLYETSPLDRRFLTSLAEVIESTLAK